VSIDRALFGLVSKGWWFVTSGPGTEREREFFSFEKKEEHLKTILFGKIEIESTVTI